MSVDGGVETSVNEFNVPIGRKIDAGVVTIGDVATGVVGYPNGTKKLPSVRF